MKGMIKLRDILRNTAISVLALVSAYALSSYFFRLSISEHISTIFVFAVFAIALFTSSYIYGVISSVVSVLLINYAYTFPFFAFDFIRPSNFISGAVMLMISVVTSLIVSSNKRYVQKEKETEKESMRANLLRAVSHDLRTPLTTINSASSLLLEEKGLSEEQKTQMIRKINDDSEWLKRLVENLLTITRIDNRTLKIEKTPTIIDELIDSVLKKFHSLHPSENVTVSIPDEIVVIDMDPLLIGQVLLNLLENAAIHATGHTRIILSVYTGQEDAVFAVEDDGCGLSDSLIKNIFSGYYERDRENDSRFSGIGLSVCATIISAHGGRITAENRKNGGALFRFTLTKEKDNG